MQAEVSGFQNHNVGLQTVKSCVNSHVGLSFFPEVETQIMEWDLGNFSSGGKEENVQCILSRCITFLLHFNSSFKPQRL